MADLSFLQFLKLNDNDIQGNICEMKNIVFACLSFLTVVLTIKQKSCFLVYAEDLARRPKLNLKPRSVKKSEEDALAMSTERMKIFGAGKPRDEKTIEKKESPDKEDKEETDKPSE